MAHAFAADSAPIKTEAGLRSLKIRGHDSHGSRASGEAPHLYGIVIAGLFEQLIHGGQEQVRIADILRRSGQRIGFLMLDQVLQVVRRHVCAIGDGSRQDFLRIGTDLPAEIEGCSPVAVGEVQSGAHPHPEVARPALAKIEIRKRPASLELMIDSVGIAQRALSDRDVATLLCRKSQADARGRDSRREVHDSFQQRCRLVGVERSHRNVSGVAGASSSARAIPCGVPSRTAASACASRTDHVAASAKINNPKTAKMRCM